MNAFQLLILLGMMSSMAATASETSVDRATCLTQLKNQIENRQGFAHPQGASFEPFLSNYDQIAPTQKALLNQPDSAHYSVDFPKGTHQQSLSMTKSSIIKLGLLSRTMTATISQERGSKDLYSLKIAGRWNNDDKINPQKISVKQEFDIDQACQAQLYRTEIVSDTIENGQLNRTERIFLGGINSKALPAKTYTKKVPTDYPLVFDLQPTSSKIMTAAILPYVGRQFYLMSDDVTEPFVMSQMTQVNPIVENQFSHISESLSGFDLNIKYAGAITDITVLGGADALDSVILSPTSQSWFTKKDNWEKNKIPALDHSREFRINYAADQDAKADIVRVSLLTLVPLDFSNMKAYWSEVHEKALPTGEIQTDFVSAGPLRYDSIASDAPIASGARHDWLASSYIVFVDSPLTKEITDEVLHRSKKPMTRLGIAQTIISILQTKISYNYSNIEVGGQVQEATTDEILRAKSGTCQNFAAVFAAVARSLGVPTRIIGGMSLDENQMGWHAWVEIEARDNLWIPLEPQSPGNKMDVFNYVPVVFEPLDTYSDFEVQSKMAVHLREIDVTETKDFE